MPRIIRGPPARLFPNAAAANRSIFYERGGRARSVSEVYSVLTQRYASAANSAGDPHRDGRGAGEQGRSRSGNRAFDNAAYLSSFPDARSVAPGAASSQATIHHGVVAAADRPVFRSLFQAGERAQPVSPAVQELWATACRSPRCRHRRRPISARRSRSICSATATARSAAKRKPRKRES